MIDLKCYYILIIVFRSDYNILPIYNKLYSYNMPKNNKPNKKEPYHDQYHVQRNPNKTTTKSKTIKK